jgi:hypothetical protein
MDRAFIIYLSHLLLFTQLAIIVIIPQVAIAVALSKTISDPPSESIGIAFNYMVERVLCYPIAIFVQAGIIHVVANLYTQTIATLKRCMVFALSRFCAVFCFDLLYSVLFYIFFIGIVGLAIFLYELFEDIPHLSYIRVLPLITASALIIYVMTSLTITLPIFVVEKRSPCDVIKRSFDLFSGYRRYIFWIFLLFFTSYFVSLMYQRLIGAIFGFSTLAVVLSRLPGIVTLPLQTM